MRIFVRAKMWFTLRRARRNYLQARKLVMQEMIVAGWQQDPAQPWRLINDTVSPHGRINMADFEAVSLHFRRYPLRPAPPEKPKPSDP